MNTPQPLKLSLASGVAAFCLATSSYATTIYQDTFARSGPLNGSAPTVDNSGNSVTWSASTAPGYTCNGSSGVINNSVNGDWQGGAHLPLDWTGPYPDPKAQIDVLVTGGGGNWLTLTLGDCDYWGYPSSSAMIKMYGNGNVDVCHGPGWDGGFVITNVAAAGVSGGWNRIRIDYSNSVGVANFYVNGNLVAQNVPITSNTTGVGLNSNCGSDSFYTNLLVTFGSENVIAPSITAQPTPQAVFVGDSIRFNVNASGTLPLTYTWKKNGTVIGGAPNSGIYTISNSAVADSGDYSVVLANGAGSVTSDVVRVDVHLEAQSALAQDNFDAPVGTAYDFAFTYSSDNTLNLPAIRTNAPAIGVGGSRAFGIYADGTDFANGSVTYAGFGGGWAQDFLPLPTHNLDFYQVSGKIRIENLRDGVTNSPGRVDLRFFAPDGTTGVTNGSQDLIFSCENHYQFTSNFQTFSFILNASDFGGASGQAAFNQYQSSVVRIQFEFTADNFYTDFVNGPGDALIIDDVKFVLRQSPAMTVTMSGSQPVLNWSDPNLVLQGASTINGGYTTIGGASSPYPVPANSPYQYFRTTFQAVP